MDNDHFNPGGFGVAPAAALSVAIGAAIISAGHNVADVIAEHRNSDAADRVNSSMANMLSSHNAMVEIVSQQRETIDEMAENIALLAAIVERQAAELGRR